MTAVVLERPSQPLLPEHVAAGVPADEWESVPNYVTIPTRDHWAMAIDLAGNLVQQREAKAIYIFDNNDEPKPIPNNHRIEPFRAAGKTITQMWNEAWLTASLEMAGQPFNMTFLNDDIEIPPKFLSSLSMFLRVEEPVWAVSPDYNRPLSAGVARDLYPAFCRGSYRHNGLAGWAFMIRGELLGNPLPLIDEQFEWWCGDDDLFLQIEARGGRLAKVVGLPLDHIGTATGQKYPELHEKGWADMERLINKYGRMAG